MSKPFITYTAQIEKLKNEKNLIIPDADFAVESTSVENMANVRKNISTPIITAMFQKIKMALPN